MATIVCIGAGRLANQLMPEFEKHGHHVIQAYNRTKSAADHLAKQLHSCLSTDSLSDLDVNADYYFILVSDDLVSHLASQVRNLTSGGKLIHASGILGLESLPDENGGIFYPLFSFSNQSEIDWNQIPIFITASTDKVKSELVLLANSISTKVSLIDSKEKQSLHVAAVFASNFTNHMLSIAEKICQENKIDFDHLKPLVLGTIQKAINNGPLESQTGPAIRGDQNTIDLHLNLLNDHPEWKAIYTLLSEDIMRMSLKD